MCTRLRRQRFLTRDQVTTHQRGGPPLPWAIPSTNGTYLWWFSCSTLFDSFVGMLTEHLSRGKSIRYGSNSGWDADALPRQGGDTSCHTTKHTAAQCAHSWTPWRLPRCLPSATPLCFPLPDAILRASCRKLLGSCWEADGNQLTPHGETFWDTLPEGMSLGGCDGD